jgi:hypothetical protein
MSDAETEATLNEKKSVADKGEPKIKGILSPGREQIKV